MELIKIIGEWQDIHVEEICPFTIDCIKGFVKVIF